LSGYHSGGRIYRLNSETFPGISAKILHEKDIPVQVAIGNYDLGICGLEWIEELLVKYPASDIIKLRNLDFGEGALFAATHPATGINSLTELANNNRTVRLASEYPNLTAALATGLRLKQFFIYPLWGAAEAYPPETADVIVLPRKSAQSLEVRGLVPLAELLDFRAFLIANKTSWQSRDMAETLAPLSGSLAQQPAAPQQTSREESYSVLRSWGDLPAATVKLALPDGHQQAHVKRIFDSAGINIGDYPSATGLRRPQSNLTGVVIKVIRPQDMPVQVANGNFDLAITGRDWLTDHLYQFPTSPVRELLDLKYGWVRLVAVVHQDLPVNDIDEMKAYYVGRRKNLRVASEYVNLADRYARSKRLGRYRVVPTWGATEAFLPDDADLLIENTETGSTLKRNNLKIIDTLFESTACVIANTGAEISAAKEKRINEITAILRRAVEAG
jgi:ATP phosphoribosyltransferase